jgi:hypothetical protein
MARMPAASAAAADIFEKRDMGFLLAARGMGGATGD